MPWRSGSPGYQNGYKARSGYPGHLAIALGRRTPEQRAAILNERLEQLRRNPPRGYPSEEEK
jgi:hypothetical protein